MLKERFIFTKEMIDKFNEYIYKLTEPSYLVTHCYKEGYCSIELEVDDNYDSMDLVTGERDFSYDYTDTHKIITNNRKFVLYILDNQIKLIKEYDDNRYNEKYILFKEFLDWLEDNHIRHTLYFREEIVGDETMISQFELSFSNIFKDESIIKYISDENKERLNRIS